MKALELRMMPTVHYCTDHLLEDYKKYHNMYCFLEEAFEAAHKEDRDHSHSSCKGREICDSEKYNTFTILIAHNHMKHLLEFDGVDEM